MAKKKKEVREIVFDDNGAVSKNSKGFDTDNEGNLGFWFTSQSNKRDKYFVRVGETPRDGWRRRLKEIEDSSIEKLKKEEELIIVDGFVMTIREYEVLKSEIFKKRNDRSRKFKRLDFVYTSDNFYVSDKFKGGQLGLVEQFNIELEREFIDAWEAFYD